MADLLEATDVPDAPASPLSDVTPPSMPDFARYIPNDVMQDVHYANQADEWAQGQNQRMADAWAQTQSMKAQDFLTQQIAQGPMQAPTPEDQPPTATADQMPDRQPVTMNDLADLFHNVLNRGRQAGQGVVGAVQDRAGQVGDYLAAKDPQSKARQVCSGLTDVALAQAPLSEQQTADAKQAIVGAVGPIGEGMLAQGKSNVENLQSGNPDERTAATLGLVNYGGITVGESKVIGKAAAAIAPEIMAKIDPAMQHAVQVAVDQGIIDAKNLDKVAAGLNDPKFVARLEATKNPTRDLKAPWQQDAYTIWTANKKMADESAAWDAIGKGAPAAAGPTPDVLGQGPAAKAWNEALKANGGDPHGPGTDELWQKVMEERGWAEPTPESVTAKALGQPPEGAPVLSERAPYTGAGESTWANNRVVQGLNTVQSALKQVVVQGMMHPLVENAQLGRTFAAELNPAGGAQAAYRANRAFLDSGFAKDWMAKNTEAIARGEAAGATGLRIGSEANPDVQTAGKTISRYLLSSGGSAVGGFVSAKNEGQSNEDALKRAAIFGVGGAGMAAAAPYINAALWGRMVPVMKTEAFNMLSKTYGDEVAAKRVNDIFGGQNLAKLARDPNTQQLIRSTVLAPDWLESWARNLGAVVKPGAEGDAARKWWAATGISSILTLEGLNMALNGHSTFDNEPGHQAQLETTGILRMAGQKPDRRTYMDINMLGPVDSLVNSVTKSKSMNPLDVAGSVAGRFASNHLNIGPSAGLNAIENYSSGKQIVPEGTPPGAAAIPEAAAAASNVVPIPLSGLTGENLPPALTGFSAVTGMRSSEGSAYTPAVVEAFKGVGQDMPKTPTTLTTSKGMQVTLDAGQKRMWENTVGKYMADNLKDSTTNGAFGDPKDADKLRQQAEKEAIAAVLDAAPDLADKAVSKKDVAEQKAVQKAGGSISPAWSAVLGKSTPASPPPAASPSRQPVAAGAGSSDAWKKALGR